LVNRFNGFLNCRQFKRTPETVERVNEITRALNPKLKLGENEKLICFEISRLFIFVRGQNHAALL